MIDRLSALLKIDMRFLLSRGGLLMAAKGVNSVIFLALAYVFANYLEPSTYGQYKYFLVAYGIVTAFTFAGIYEIIVASVARFKKNYLPAAARIYLSWQPLVALAGLGTAGYYYYAGNNDFALAFLAIAVVAPLANVLSLYSVFLNGSERYQSLTLIQLLQSLLILLTLASLVFIEVSALELLLGFLVATLLGQGIGFLYAIKTGRFEPATLDKDQIKDAKQFSINKILQKIIFHIDTLLVFHFLGAAQLAFYTFALTVPKEIQSTNKLLKILTIPRFSQQSLTVLKQAVHRKVVLYLLFMIGVIGMYYLAAPFIFATFFPVYIDAVIYSQIFSLILLFAPQALYRQALTAHLQITALNYYDGIIAVSKIGLLVTLIPIWGLWGAIAGVIVTRAIGFLTVFIFFLRAKEKPTVA